MVVVDGLCGSSVVAMACARHARRAAVLPALALVSLAQLAPWRAWVAPSHPRRQMLLLPGLSLGAPLAAEAAGFSPSDLGMAEAGSSLQAPVQRVESTDELENAIYLISRVQEATVQQERLVTTGKFKDVQRNSITMALNMMLDNYRLADQASQALLHGNHHDEHPKLLRVS
eukprot:s4281_g9.t1